MAFSFAMIPRNAGPDLVGAAIAANFARTWPREPRLKLEAAAKDQIVYKFAGGEVILQIVRMPIPWGDLEDPSRRSWLWKGAEAALRHHTSHAIVFVKSETGQLDRARLLTRVCTSVLATCPSALGVYWGSAELVVSSKVFQDAAVGLLPQSNPIFLWVDARVGPAQNGKFEGYTVGLKDLGEMEIETQTSPEGFGGLRERFFDMAAYVLNKQNKVKDGDTVGSNPSEKIRVTFSKSAFGQPGTVMRLDYAAASPP